MRLTPEYFKTREDGVKLYITRSKNGYYIIQNETGIPYEEAVDVEGSPYTYDETDIPINSTNEQGGSHELQ